MCVIFLMIRRPPRSTQSRSSAASDVYKRQVQLGVVLRAFHRAHQWERVLQLYHDNMVMSSSSSSSPSNNNHTNADTHSTVSYTHLRAHETVLDLVCRLLLEKKKTPHPPTNYN
eukprot:TRINITY_DN2785_c0_g1_i1.p1 TRINITY_DN2785_c0_g1~~TRINITY_DN2785_c0_g1_i1.p1  ORF type:complete len:114 (-),score=54.30 TRINITY_DN2785_c0_g1_i1:24-365(-)